ncbi:hypothetical protein PFUM301598_13790 [Pseudomonas fluorescens]
MPVFFPKILADFARQMGNDQRVPSPSGAQVSEEKLTAVRACKNAGLIQRELGLPTKNQYSAVSTRTNFQRPPLLT